MVRLTIGVRNPANVGCGAPTASMPKTFLMLLATASTHSRWPESAL
ncbi:Uncharacterised protein [Mycobacterium tuberculosis]|nr:Uncharacterised protein [Mycobacterium tuberculosis]